MAGSHATDLNGLLRGLPHYLNQRRIYEDLVEMTNAYSSLAITVGVFAYGSQELKLIFAFGTIPITYNRVSYNVPITLFFDPPYPNCSPRCYITPTQSMSLRPNHRYVSMNGVIVHPYISSWNPRSSSLVHLLATFSNIFSTDPPVFALPEVTNGSHKTGGFSTTGQAASAGAGLLADKRLVTTVNGNQLYRYRLLKNINCQIATIWNSLVEPVHSEIQRQLSMKAELSAAMDDVNLKLIEYSSFLGSFEKSYKEALELVEFLKKEVEDISDAKKGIGLFEIKNPLSKQVLDLTAEISAYEDLINITEGQLGMLNQNPSYIKAIRSLFSEYYIARHLNKKALAALRMAAATS